MKKLFAILLVLAVLIPMGVVAQAEEPAKKPFITSNWERLPEGQEDEYKNVYRALLFHIPDKFKPDLQNGNLDGIRCSSLNGTDIPSIAAEMKELFDTYPEGARHINFSPLRVAIHNLSDVCFSEKVAPLFSKWMDEFMAEYKRIGGKLDGVNLDIEYLDIYSNYIYSDYYKKDNLVYDKIVKNPAYAEKIRPLLVERGFKFYSPVTAETPEIFGIHPNAGGEYANCSAIWDAVLASYQGQVLTDSCAPVWKYFPDAVVSDYSANDAKPWINGGSGGIRGSAGNASNEFFYSTNPAPTFFRQSNKPMYPTIRTRVDAIFDNNAYNRFIYEANIAKKVRQATDGGITWTIAHPYYGEDWNPYVRTPYYTELIYHLGLLDPALFHGYIIRQDCEIYDESDGKWYDDPEKYADALKVIDQCMEQLNKVAGYADRKPINVSAEWNHEYVLSGMYAGGKNIWRLTPDNNVVTLEDFQVKDAKDPTFTINGETITFPGGKIIEDDKIFDVGSYGFWIQTAADVTPVVTRVAEYFRVNPSYQETFEGYKAGTEFTFTNALPEACWENKKVGNGTAVVIADPTNADNQVLEVKGGYNFKNVKLPSNVNAADGYAKRQAWEVTVTLPSDVAEDDELILLNIIPEKKKAKDQGIKVAGTKVYYDNAGEYVEMEGVALTAGGKYTFVREMDFTTADAFTYNLYIYDAEGKEVAKAKKIAAADQTIPVYSLGMSVKNASGAAVLLDDYKIYPTRVAADFTTFNAKTGMAVEADKAEAANVAFRLSWLNTEQTEKSYTVMAAYYDGETKVSEEVVQEIKLPANGDGIITGVVENKQEGKSLLVYLKDNNPAEEEEIVTPGGDEPTEEPKAGLDTTMIIIIAAAAAAVVIAVVVIVIVASAKKKKKTAAAIEAPVVEAAEETAEATAEEASEETTEE